MWWPVWIAPLPILFLAPKMRVWEAFAAALAAHALAGLSFWNYLRYTVQFPLWLELVSILIPSACFAFALVLYQGFARKNRRWLAAISFPVVIVAAEYLFSLSQGTFINTGYTQLKNLPVLQLAAVAGLWGISFTVNLFPAGLAALAAAPAKSRLRFGTALAVYYACILTYGFARLYNAPPAHDSVVVGLVETHAGRNIFPPDAQTTMALLQEYASQVQPLAARGAQFVLFPEMSALVPDSHLPQVDALFQRTARAANVQILLGVIHVTDHAGYNEGRLYSATGAIETVYRKHYPVPTWEARTTPGTGISVLACPRPNKQDRAPSVLDAPQAAGNVGIEICRDMDFPELSRRYAEQQVGLMLVPAWDQGVGVDAYWHGHLALMRAVEDGFTMVRDAKVGLMTVSDDRGRILAEEPTRPDGTLVTMLVTVPVRHDSTLYQKWGDWFAWLDLAGLAALLALWVVGLRRGKEPQPQSNSSPASRKQRLARATSFMICAFSASGDGQAFSPRRRSRNSSLSSVRAPSSMGSKLRMCDSTANDASPNVGRLPTLVTD
jgi:apolipoprotein N-acyltransferase